MVCSSGAQSMYHSLLSHEEILSGQEDIPLQLTDIIQLEVIQEMQHGVEFCYATTQEKPFPRGAMHICICIVF